MKCGYQLSWYDLVPVFSWLCLKGRCRKCKEPISPQYPIIEALNGVLYVVVFLANDFKISSILYCLLTSALIVLSVIDLRTYEIPLGINIFILILGIVQVGLDYKDWLNYLGGFLSVSIFLWLLLVLTKGRAIGGGDVKLMAAAGLLLGLSNIILAFILACILGSIIHIVRMKAFNAERVLAMGPYLSLGIFIAALWGERMVSLYFGMLMY